MRSYLQDIAALAGAGLIVWGVGVEIGAGFAAITAGGLLLLAAIIDAKRG